MWIVPKSINVIGRIEACLNDLCCTALDFINKNNKSKVTEKKQF